MASKTGKRASKAGKSLPDHMLGRKDDGTRWVVIDPKTGLQIYPGREGVPKWEAERLATGLKTVAGIREVM